MATFWTIIIITLVIFSSLLSKKKKKVKTTFLSQPMNEGEEWSPLYSEQSREGVQNFYNSNEVANKVEETKRNKNNVKSPTTKKKFDIKSAMIYSAIMERPYEY